MAHRPRRRRLTRTLLAALVTASVAVPVSGAARPAEVPAPAPAAPGPLRDTTPAALARRYATTRADIRAAERAADAHGDHRRAAALRTMAAPARHFLAFDGRDGGRSAETYGDLSRADRIAVLVPGSDTGLDTYHRLRAGAQALQERLQRQPGIHPAVIAWLGYPTPATIGPAALTTARADAAAPQLRQFIGQLKNARPAARITVLCHSYGSVVCGRAAAGLPADALVLYGSPGASAGSAADLHTRATVWAGRGAADWIRHVPHTRLPLPGTTLGFGTDPVSPRFGAHIFPAGDGGHSDYLKPGTRSLESLARITAGRSPDGGPDGAATAPHPAVEARRA
ncbi:alpha/beta hydrolase family protein (plasmid) [Streptomyces sp. BHT-5-2]|uniref:alpha/beta hydrolase n=1 Tax=Streptomyces sp. BHT-5-2 TaxID=2866715 RepID=UPI001C8DCBDE|nr:alpha/beta hydrolase [Streptomyces sp. BHT-5-2]QZL07425.1 alpha/beta hydrolase family protein [Streptomyces sp. BHT-5-2]